MSKLFNKYNQFSQLKKNVFSGTVFSVFNTLITLISYPIYLKYLGAEKYGLWSIVSVVFSFSQFGQMGIDTAITKYVATEYWRGNLKGITEYMTTAFYILIIPSLAVTLLMIFFRSQIADFVKLNDVFRSDGMQLMLFVGFLSVFSFFVFILRGLVVGIGRMDTSNYVFLIGRVLQIVVNVIFLMAGMGIWSLYYGFVVYFFVPAIIWYVMMKKTYHIEIFEFRAFNKEKMKELLRYGGMLMTGTVAQMFVAPFNNLIIGRYIGLVEVTYYQIAVQAIMAIRNLFVKGLESILPKISEVHEKGAGSITSVLSVHKKGMKIIFLFALPLFVLLFIFADPVMRLWLRGEFNLQIVVVLKILLVGWVINALAVPDYFMFLGIGKVGYGVSATCIKSITNVVFIFLLLLLSVHMTLNKVVVIDAISLSMAVIYLKFKYVEYKKMNRVTQN